ncbi:MAG: cytochrome P450 [Halieaceae bacterium]|jgi:cytochrome P450|nr:cytochrome P450 [Halieaceae bacterium]
MATIEVGFLDFQKDFDKYMTQCQKSGDLIEIVTSSGDLNMYVVSTHGGCCEVLRNDGQRFVHFAEYFDALQDKSEVDQKIGEVFAKNLGNNSDLHLELRKDIRNHFNGTRVDQHNDFFHMVAGQLVDELELIADKNNGLVELIEDFTKPLSFIVTTHVIGLEFKDRDEQKKCRELAGEAIKLVALLAPEKEKITALKAFEEFSDFILPQLEKFRVDADQGLRTNCLLYDFGEKIRAGHEDKLENFICLVNGLFQAGLGATGNSLALCLNLLLEGNDDNSADDIRTYFMAPERTVEEKNEAVSEYIRVATAKLGNVFPRYSQHATAVEGEPIKPNSLVYMSLRKANMDDRAFSKPQLVNPERMKIPPDLSPEALKERRYNRIEKSLNFSYGEHMCPGRRLALVVIRYALEELLRRFPNMAVEDMNIVGEMFGTPTAVTSLTLRLDSA